MQNEQRTSIVPIQVTSSFVQVAKEDMHALNRLSYSFFLQPIWCEPDQQVPSYHLSEDIESEGKVHA